MRGEFTCQIAFALLDHLNAGIVYCSQEGIIIYCNRYFEKISGFKGEELVGKDIFSLHGKKAAEKIRLIFSRIGRVKCKDIIEMPGFKSQHYKSILSPVIDADGVCRGVCLLTYDVSADEKIKEDLRMAAQTDAMTGLLNRMSFNQVMHNMKRHFDGSNSLVLIMVDINGLKIINDQLGHGEGDFIIKKCSQILRDSVRKDDTVFRIGGDEFVVVMKNANQEEGELVASRIKSNCEEWNRRSEKPFRLLVSIGVACATTREEMESLLHRTDQAMYYDKKVFYDEREGKEFYGILR